MKEMNIDDFKQGIIVIGIAVVGIVAAIQGNWTVVGSILTGGFAILQSNKS
jgi:hypothetical protein